MRALVAARAILQSSQLDRGQDLSRLSASKDAQNHGVHHNHYMRKMRKSTLNIDRYCPFVTGNHQAKRSFRPRSFVLTGALVLSCCALLSTFVPAPRVASVTAPSANAGTAAALTAATLVTPQVAFADEGSVWIPALSAIGAGFAIGAVSWCGSQESGFVSPDEMV